MVGGVRKVERSAQPHDLADQTLTGFHAGDVDSILVQAFSCKQLHVANGAEHVERTDLGHHRLRDRAHNNIQA